MFTICEKCGNRMTNMTEGNCTLGMVTCECGNSMEYKRLPLFILTGASGVGKSTIGRRIMSSNNKVIVLESDIFWNDYFNKPETNYREYREMLLNVSRNINQSGKSVLLVGCGVPEQYEALYQRSYFSNIIYISLVTSNSQLKEQLVARPSFRNCNNESYIIEHQNYNQWNKDNYDKTIPKMIIVDIEKLSVEETVNSVCSIIEDEIQI